MADVSAYFFTYERYEREHSALELTIFVRGRESKFLQEGRALSPAPAARCVFYPDIGLPQYDFWRS